jgi:hypothetical protein
MAETHMWTASSPQGVLQRFDQIVASICLVCQCARLSFSECPVSWIDHTICPSSCKFGHRLSTVAVFSCSVAPVSGQSLRGDRGLRAVGFPGHHHLPGDTRGLVDNPKVRFLIANDAAGEGVNLQRGAHLMVNYDLPWNPNQLEQRFGRIHRIGQTEVCHRWSLIAAAPRRAPATGPSSVSDLTRLGGTV